MSQKFLLLLSSPPRSFQKWKAGKYIVLGILCGFVLWGNPETSEAFTIKPDPDISVSLNSAQTQLTVNASGTAGHSAGSCSGGCSPQSEDPACLPNVGGAVIGIPYLQVSPGQVYIKQSINVLLQQNISFSQVSGSGDAGSCPDDSGGAASFTGNTTLNVSTLANGTYTAELRVCSTTNSSTCQNVSTTFAITNRGTSSEPTTAPTVWVTLSPDPGAGWTRQDVTATIHCKRADNSACVNLRYKVIAPTYSGTCANAPVTFTNGASVTISENAKVCGTGRNGPNSGEGLQGFSDVLSVRVDQTAPTCGTFSPNPANWTNSPSQMFSMTGQDDSGGSGLTTSSGGTKTCTVSSNGGACTITISDIASNTRICASPPAKIDTTAPTVTADPSSATSPSNIVVNLGAWDESGGSGITAARYAVNASLPASATSGTAFGSSVSVTLSGVRTHSISYWVKDIAGNERTGSFNYTIVTPSASCGNSTVDSGAGETCDDGNSGNGDGCSSLCQFEQRQLSCSAKPASAVWNGTSSYTQTCSASNGSSCSAWSPNPTTGYDGNSPYELCSFTCSSGNVWNGSSCVFVSGGSCGNNVMEAGESCDDGNIGSGDGCSNSCQFEQKTFTCAAKPQNTIWNSISSYTQTCEASNGFSCTSWNYPDDAITEYNVTSSNTSCRFACAGGFTWNGSACVAGSASGNAAQYVSQSLPVSPLTAGQTYTVSVTMKNIGSTSWTKTTNYKFGSQSPQDNVIWGNARIQLPDGVTVAPNQTHTFTFSITAPATSGTYDFQWRMLREGVEWFGEFSELRQLTVVAPSWNGNVHNSAYGQDLGWVLFGNPASTAYSGRYAGVKIAGENEMEDNFSTPDAWIKTGNVAFNVSQGGRTTARIGGPGWENITSNSTYTGVKRFKMDFYPSVTSGLPHPLALDNTTYRSAVLYSGSGNNFVVQTIINGASSSPFTFPLTVVRNTWYTIDLTYNGDGTTTSCVYTSGLSADPANCYTSSNFLPLNWSYKVKSWSDVNYMYLSNFRAGVNFQSGTYPLSGEAYSELFGKVDFSGTAVTMRGGWGVLTGTAHFPATAATLNLSAGTVPCNDYKNSFAPPSAQNYGVCIDPNNGFFYGSAWSPQYGWLSFAGNTPSGVIGTSPVHDDSRSTLPYQVTSEWRSTISELTVQTQSDVFLASESIPSIPLVSTDSGTVNCANINSVLMHKLVPGTTYAVFKSSTNKSALIERTFQKGIDYTISCVNEDVILTLQSPISAVAGYYWLTGNIYGNELVNAATNANSGIQVTDPVTFQIIPAATCWDGCGGQPSSVKVQASIADTGNDYPIGDGTDTYRFEVSLRDRFGNPVNLAEPLWFDPAKKIADNVFRVVFDDHVSLVQILGEVGAGVLGNATKYRNLQNTNISVSGIITPEPGTTYKNVTSVIANLNQMQFEVASFAPTNYIEGSLTEDNRLAVKDLSFTRTLNDALGLSRLSAVTQAMSNAELPAAERPALTALTTAVQTADRPYLVFAPLLTARPEFPTTSYAEGRPGFFTVVLEKASAAIFTNPFWLQELGTQSATGEIHRPRKINFSDFHPTAINTANLFTSAFNFFEGARSGNSATTTAFSSLRTGTIHAVLATLLQTASQDYEMTFIPEMAGSWAVGDRILYRSFISYLIDGKTPKYAIGNNDPRFCSGAPFNAPGCPLPPSECSDLTIEECCERNPNFCQENPGVGQTGLSVIGPTHGQGVVSEQVSNLEGVSFEKGSFSYAALQESIRRNIANLTRGLAADSAPQNPFETITPDTHDENTQLISMDPDLIFANVDELFTPASATAITNSRGIGRLLEEGRLLWVTAGDDRENPQGFTIVLDDSVLPSTNAARTLVVEGGNVYLKGNITGNGHLAIILLKNRAADPAGALFTRYGNLLIHPCVTNIRAAVYAEGSLLTMDDGEDCNGSPAAPALGIFDGFGNATEWSGKLINQLYFQGIFATQNTAGGTTQIGNPNVLQSGTVGIPNSAEIFFPPNTSFSSYTTLSAEQKIKIAKRFDIRVMRNFSRTLVLEDDQNGNNVIDDFEAEFATDPAFCDTTNCVPDQNGPKKWTTVELDAEEAERFDGQEWLDLLPYASDGTCADCDPVEAAKFRSAVIFEYDPSLQKDTPIGFTLPREVETSSGGR